MPVDRRPPRHSATDRAARRLVAGTSLGRRIGALAAELRGRHVPLHWTNMFGAVSLACLIVVFLTGIFLMFVYSPSSTPVTYHGGYGPLEGATMSEALRSTLRISFEIPGGLLVRQAHHWAALLLPASLMLQLVTTYFFGGFRKPRRLGWVLLFGILILALVGGWSGYALPDDMLSGSGLRIVEGIVLGIPIVGTWLSALLFGGEFPGEIIAHLYPIHVVIVPLAMIGLIVLRARAAYRNRPAQLPGSGRTEDNVVGVPVLPNAAARAGGLLLIAMAVIVLISATVTVSPIWLYGPSAPGDASAGSQPDWYTGFLDGALRLVPPGWEFVWLGHTWTLSVLVPLAVVGLFLVGVLFYPFIEQWISADDRDHHLLDRPRNTPTRTAIGAGAITFYCALWGVGSADLAATHFHLGVETVVAFYQVIVIVGPVIAFEVTRRVCLGLQRKDQEILLHGFETGRVVRLPGGEYIEVHQPIDQHERWRLINTSVVEPFQARPDERGHLGRIARLRASVSRFFFEDRIAPLVRTEVLGRSDNGVDGERLDEESARGARAA
jgi:ubiquinol-cytochrome c reductase cytochrome b subunit